MMVPQTALNQSLPHLGILELNILCRITQEHALLVTMESDTQMVNTLRSKIATIIGCPENLKGNFRISAFMIRR
ncbi:hypothetical protein BBDE_1915 [Bifidobacterium dentium JCM 1195 = DSM 20436]|nr:hypothetical protein BBDE_1915 [Bifidobacterium dentium JCM 1195 = DSM 20436]